MFPGTADSHPGRGLRRYCAMLPPPRFPTSARIAAILLLALLALTITALAIPQHLPRLLKEIVCFAWLLPGAPLLILLANDLSTWRREQIVARHAHLPAPVPARPTAPASVDASGDVDDDEDNGDDDAMAFDVVVDEDGVSAELLARWRGWRWWLLGIAGLTAAVWAVFGDVWMALGFYVLVPALVRELYLALNALEAMTPGMWSTLSTWERLWLRAWPFVLGLGLAAAFLAAVNLFAAEFWKATWTPAFVVQVVGGSVIAGWALFLMGGGAWRLLRMAVKPAQGG
jgi:hypothetical protein